MRPVLVLDGVHAHDTAGPRGKPRGSLAGASLALGPGVHAILGAPEDGTLALQAVVSGARAPHRGQVTVAGRDPARTAFLRARLGVLSPEPGLPAARTVRDAVRIAMRARGETGDRFDAVLSPLGLGPLHGRDPRALSFAEERAVELALALSTPAPILIALHEPACEVAAAPSDLVASRLRDLGAAGACVVITTSSPADASRLGDRVLALHRGVIAREVGEGSARPIELTVWVERGARELCAALAGRPEVHAVMWEAAATSGAWPGATAVRVRAADATAGAVAVAEAVAASSAEVLGIERRAPDLGEVQRETEALWQMARVHAAAAMVAPAPMLQAAPISVIAPAAEVVPEAVIAPIAPEGEPAIESAPPTETEAPPADPEAPR